LLIFSKVKKFVHLDWLMFIHMIIDFMKPRRPQTLSSDRHYSLKVAEHAVKFVLQELLFIMMPGYRLRSVLVIFAPISFLGIYSYPFQLWTYKGITWASRADRCILEIRDFFVEAVYYGLCQLERIMSPLLTPLFGNRPMYYTKTIFLLAMLHGCFTLGKPIRGWQQVVTITLVIVAAIVIDLKLFTTTQNCSTGTEEPTRFYRYRTLTSPEYRLLLLYPRWTFDSIRCSLLDGPITKLLDYEAVSYTWGSPEKTREILVDGYRIKVTESAYEMLLSMSSLWFPKLLWVDAICINQENDAEKAEQVQLMQMIYSSAILVNVWLGNPAKTIDASQARSQPGWSRYAAFNQSPAARMIQQKARWAINLLSEIQIVEHGFLQNELEIYARYAGDRGTRFHISRWDGLIELLRQPWFERIWVVQEVALASHAVVYYGNQLTNWETLAYGLKVLKDRSEIVALLEWSRGIRLRQLQQTALYNADRINCLKDSGYARNLPDLLFTSMHFKATDPRDLIYGILGLCTEEERGMLLVDYSSPVEKVYLEAAWTLCQNEGIQLLLSCGIGTVLKRRTELPSWVPDWEATQREAGHWEGVRQKQIEFAKSSVKPEIELLHGNVLQLSGHRVDHIKHIGPLLYDSAPGDREWSIIDIKQLAQKLDEVKGLVDSSPEIEDPYPHTTPYQPLSEALWRTLTDSKKDETSPKFVTYFTQWEQDLREIVTSSDLTSPAIFNRLRSMHEGIDRIQSICYGKRFFISRNGFIGLCPRYTTQNDVICIAPGVTSPFLLRQKSKQNAPGEEVVGTYLLVGSCHVHGLMEREAALTDIETEHLIIV
tara:strand:- start:8941 stop:11418 length:2478 start_codon:yes stop_codon:yes gene_type:complete